MGGFGNPLIKTIPSYTQVSSLNLHKRAIHQKIKFPCDQCEYQATTWGNLKIHKDAKHLKIRYPCAHCDYSATQMSSLRRHFKSKHVEAAAVVGGGAMDSGVSSSYL